MNGSYPIRVIKHTSLAAFCIVWASLGLFGHDPWKPDEAYTFSVKNRRRSLARSFSR